MANQEKDFVSIGGLVGKMSGGKIVNCRVEGKIIYDGAVSNVAGLVGSMENGEIENSSSNMEIINVADFRKLFEDLRTACGQIEINKRCILLSGIDEMEESLGKATFKNKYRAFVESAADHMTLLAPFITGLREFL
ncbi:hypothetical protein CSV67_05965 [Sporosarcina sp. P2]|uniref:GLUG motif-containing protein n=1 Tax=unclassified Sporosarcina TaxID=2647733 RepID=UPI000C170900|nr:MULTISPECIES: GLUG motif-containing protein [unclassified Sporosarcina]PIC69059.1 hypothetical protein CSV77_15655 [Sporosarcina sp. P16b]PID03011.1 hypothetical protein CSV67_05965 [Sporosarcina sp. P2]